MNNNDLIEKARDLPGFQDWEDTYREVEEKSIQQLKSFFQNILIASSSVFGIIVSLHPYAPQCQYTRWVFLCGIVLLSLGILASGLSLYILSTVYDRMRAKLLKQEYDNVCAGKPHIPGNVTVGGRTASTIFQRCSVLSLLFSLVSFTIYMIMIYY